MPLKSQDVAEEVIEAAGALEGIENDSATDVVAEEGVGSGTSAACVFGMRVKYDVCHMPSSYQLVDSAAAAVTVTAGAVTKTVLIAAASGTAVTVTVVVTVCICICTCAEPV
jgi:hypothetical protein